MFLVAPLLIKLLWKFGQKVVPFAILLVIAGGIYRTYTLQNFFDGWNVDKKVTITLKFEHNLIEFQ